MTARIEVVNWSRFQHYKNRNPPWIKLHRALLDNRAWAALSGDASKLLAECWLLASEYDDGAIPMTARDLAWRLRRPDASHVARLLQELATHGFVKLCEQDASAMLAERKQDATPEAEAERETEKETDPPGGALRARPEPEVVEAEVIDDDPSEVPGDVGGKVVALRPVAVEDMPFSALDWEGRTNGAVVLREWIKLQPVPPSPDDRNRFGWFCKAIADHHTTGEVALAFLGMRFLWPYAPPPIGKNEPWTPEDLKRVFPKAVAAAGNHPQFVRQRQEREFNEALDRAVNDGGGW